MRTAALFFAFASLCFAQLDDNTVTVTVARNITPQPDQAVVSVTVTTPTNGGLDAALAALQGTGVTSDNLVYANTLASPASPAIDWQFSKSVPFSGLKDLLAALANAQQKLQQPEDLLTYFVQSQASQAAQQSPALCPIPTLVADAQSLARQVAAAAGVRIGGVASMSQGAAAAVPTLVYSSGYFAQGVIYDPSTTSVSSVSLSRFLVSQPRLPSGCSLTVQFQLLH